MAPGCSPRTHLFGPPSRIESNGESQLRGDALDRGADPRAPGGWGFWRLVLILSITGRPPPQRGWGFCRLLLPSLHSWEEWQGRDRAISILCEKGSTRPNAPEKAVHLSPGAVLKLGLSSLSTPSLPLPTPQAFFAGWGICLGGAGLHQEFPFCTGLGPRAQRTDTRNRCQLLPSPGGRGPELPGKRGKVEGGGAVSKATAPTNKQHQAHGEDLWKERIMHHPANGAPNKK